MLSWVFIIQWYFQWYYMHIFLATFIVTQLMVEKEILEENISPLDLNRGPKEGISCFCHMSPPHHITCGVHPHVRGGLMFQKYDVSFRRLRVCLNTTYFIENWKHCSKTIFKWVNSTVEPILNFFFNKVVVGPVNSAWKMILSSKAETLKKKKKKTTTTTTTTWND